MKKTWGTEVASATLVFLGYLAFTGNLEMVNVLVWPIMGFATTAFFGKRLQQTLNTKPNG